MSDLIYKFLSAENALKVVEGKRLKISLLSDLNDIYDCAPIIEPLGGEGDHYLRSCYTKRTISSLNQDYGLLCFTKNHRSPLLWGHYSASATGIALGFDPKRFVGKEFLYANSIDVKYARNRPSYSMPHDRAQTQEEAKDLFIACFGVKAREWRYEREVRYVMRLSQCETRAGMYFYPFVQLALREVIIGCRSSVPSTYVSHCLDKHYQGIGVALRKAKAHSTKYKVAVVDIPQIQPGPRSLSEFGDRAAQ